VDGVSALSKGKPNNSKMGSGRAGNGGRASSGGRAKARASDNNSGGGL